MTNGFLWGKRDISLTISEKMIVKPFVYFILFSMEASISCLIKTAYVDFVLIGS